MAPIETAALDDGAPLFGWGRRGGARKAYGHWKTFTAALRHDPIDATACSTARSTERSSCSRSREFSPTLSPGDVAILDNLGNHKDKAARRREGQGALT